MVAWSRKTLKNFNFFCVFLEKQPLTANFQNSVLKGFIATPIDVLSSNFAKFGRRDIGKIMRCLPDKKISPGSPALDTARIAPEICHSQPQIMYSVFQVSSKSVHFRRSYTWSLEYHQSVLESEFNIQPKPSFKPNHKSLKSFIRLVIKILIIHKCCVCEINATTVKLSLSNYYVFHMINSVCS